MEEHHILFPIPGLPDHLTLMIYMSAILVVFSFFMKRKLSVVPGKMQCIIEIIYDAFAKMGLDIMGPKGKVYIPWIITFFLYILISNAFGVVPGFAPATMNLNITLGLALIVFVLTHVVGVKEHGFRYYKHFLGPSKYLIPLMLPIEIFSHLARPVSLSMRLFGNMFGHETLVAVLIGLIATMPIFAVPLYIFSTVLGMLIIVIQAYIFALLSMAYLGMAFEEAH